MFLKENIWLSNPAILPVICYLSRQSPYCSDRREWEYNDWIIRVSVPDEIYPRSGLCALILISTFLFIP